MTADMLTKGDDVLLDLQDSARRRVTCGLSWGAMAGSAGDDASYNDMVDREGLEKGASALSHDLDLICLMFDKFGNFIDGVTGEEDNRSADNGNVYHTGDVKGGADIGDDEQLSIELFNLSSKIHQIFFVVEVQSGHKFGEITDPRINIANATDGSVMTRAKMDSEAGEDLNAFLFGSIRRDKKGWVFKYVGDYFDGAAVTDWTATLKSYIELIDLEGGEIVQMHSAEKGETVNLKYSREARQRVFVGLNWDPFDEEVKKIDKLKNRGHNIESFDLDLACVMFNRDGEPVDGVSAKPDETVDQSGNVYHSGDHTSGEGAQLDDETISVELKNIPDYIHHIIFIAEIQSLHKFKDVYNPYIRLADGKTNDDQLNIRLDSLEGADMNAYIFVHIFKRNEAWKMTLIDEYADGEQIEDWIEHLSGYLG